MKYSRSPIIIINDNTTGVQVIEEEGIQANAGKIGDLFITELMKFRDEFEVVGDVRGKGLMLGAELVKSKVREGERDKGMEKEGTCMTLKW